MECLGTVKESQGKCAVKAEELSIVSTKVRLDYTRHTTRPNWIAMRGDVNWPCFFAWSTHSEYRFATLDSAPQAATILMLVNASEATAPAFVSA